MKFYMIAFLSAAIVASNFVAKAQEANVKTVSTKIVANKYPSQDDILSLLNDAASQVVIGGVYCSSYIPSDLYQVLTVALDTNTNEEVVVYQALFGVGAIWVRPVSEWVAVVEIEGAALPHYQLIDEADIVFVAADIDVVADTIIAEDLVADQIADAALEADLATAESEVVYLESEVSSLESEILDL